MKTTIKLALIAIAALSFASCETTGSTAGSARGVKPYTKDVCLVTDNKLGSMGDPVSLIHEGQEIKFCCKACVKEFDAAPEKFLANLR